jgi:hypothetical protein
MRTRVVPASEVSSKSLLARDFVPNKRGAHPKRHKPMVEAIRQVKAEVDDGFQLTVGEAVDLCIASGAGALLFNMCRWVYYQWEELEGDAGWDALGKTVLALLLQDEELDVTNKFQLSVSYLKRSLLDYIENEEIQGEDEAAEAAYQRLCAYTIERLFDAADMVETERRREDEEGG